MKNPILVSASFNESILLSNLYLLARCMDVNSVVDAHWITKCLLPCQSFIHAKIFPVLDSMITSTSQVVKCMSESFN